MSDANNPAGAGGNKDPLKDLIRDVLSGVLRGKYEVQSIAEQARRSIMMYRVLVSASLREIPLASDISKYLEGMYSVFTLLILGFNPMASNNADVKKLLDGISAESFNPANISAESFGLLQSLENAMMFHEQSRARAVPRIGRSAEAKEEEDGTNAEPDSESAADKRKKKEEEEYKADTSGHGSNHTIIESKTTTTDKDTGTTHTVTRADVHRKVGASDISEATFLDRLEDLKAYPTIIKMKIQTSDKTTVIVPIAIKANCYGIKSAELRLLIESGMSGKPASLLRQAKWRSGELKTMEYIFGTDFAARDKALYKELGRNPWYIELQARKAASKGNKLVQGTKIADSDLYKETKDYLKLKGDIPPTASLIVTKDDIVTATRLDAARFTKNDNFVKKFMKEMFLLCLGIVDMDLQMITFYFMGYDTPFIESFADIAKSSKDANQALYEAIRELSRKVY